MVSENLDISKFLSLRTCVSYKLQVHASFQLFTAGKNYVVLSSTIYLALLLKEKAE